MLVGLGVNTLGSRSEVRTAVGCTKNEIFAYQRQTEKKYFTGKKDMKHLQTSKEIIRAKNFHTYLVFTVSGVEIIHLTFGTVYTIHTCTYIFSMLFMNTSTTTFNTKIHTKTSFSCEFSAQAFC